MRKDKMTRRKLFTQLSGGLQQSFIIRNKYLDMIANVSDLPGDPTKLGTERGDRFQT